MVINQEKNPLTDHKILRMFVNCSHSMTFPLGLPFPLSSFSNIGGMNLFCLSRLSCQEFQVCAQTDKAACKIFDKKYDSGRHKFFYPAPNSNVFT